MSVSAFQAGDLCLSQSSGSKGKRRFILAEINRFKLPTSRKVQVTFVVTVVTQLFCGGSCPACFYCMASTEIKFKNAVLKIKIRICSWWCPANPEPQEAQTSPHTAPSMWLCPRSHQGFPRGGATGGSLKF